MRYTKRVVTDDAVIRMMGLLKEKGYTQKDLVKHIGVDNGSFSRWKYDNTRSYLKYIDEIASFLDTTPEYILYGESKKESSKTKYAMTDKDVLIVDMLHEIDDYDEVDAIYHLVKTIWMKNKELKKGS